jgi:putative membrane protein
MNYYLLFKSLHLISMISWLAGLLYLPRIFVYHSEIKDNLEQMNTFSIMEKKLYNYIMMPAMLSTWFFGFLLIYILDFKILYDLWFQIKIILVIFLTYYHFFLGSCVKVFSINQNVKSSKFYRIMNEVPTVLLIFIIFLAVFKPL